MTQVIVHRRERWVDKEEFHPQASLRTVRDSLPSYGSWYSWYASTVAHFPVIKQCRARFTKGIIKPLEKVELAEGIAGGWKGLIDAEELKNNIYEGRLIFTRPEFKLRKYETGNITLG